MVEIERKYLVHKTVFKYIDTITPAHITQAYLVNEKSKSVRVRMINDRAFLTIKSEMKNLTRSEYEYEIPVNEALSLIEDFDLKGLKKLRYKIEYQLKTWEIDVFEGKLEGLVIAEIELEKEDEKFEIPEWVDQEVTFDPTYLNANLINRL